MELPKAVKNFELPQSVRNIELPAAMKNLELPNVVKNFELPAAVKNIELPEAVKNVPNAVKNIDISVNTSMITSFASSAMTSVAFLTKSFQQKVEETTKTIQQEHKEFVKQVKEETLSPKPGTEAVAPWVGLPNEDKLKQQILALSQDKRNFTIPPPENTNFQFDMHIYFQTAMATLQSDQNLNRMRFELVPSQVPEPTFWKNYFYRVSLIKQTALGSDDPVVLKNQVYSKVDENESNEKDLLKNDNKEIKEDSTTVTNPNPNTTTNNTTTNNTTNNNTTTTTTAEDDKGILFDIKNVADSETWMDGLTTTEGGDEELPENWEEQMREHLSTT